MNKNVESHFSEVPYIDKPRSIFDRSFEHITTFNVGQVIPFMVDPVMPGDTFRVSTSHVTRLQTLLTPIFGNMYLEFSYWFCPTRLEWEHQREFYGENTTGPWVQTTTYRVPAISAPASTGFQSGTLADYMGLPVGVTWSASDRNAPSAIPFRCYADIINEFWRDENLTYPLNIPRGDSNQTGSNGSNYINDIANGGMPFVACKYHDEFSSCLPSPLRAAQPVSVGISSGYIPVISRTDGVPFYYDTVGIRGIPNKTLSGDDGRNSSYLGFIVDSYGTPTSKTQFRPAGEYNNYPNFDQDGSWANNWSGFVPVNLWADAAHSSGVNFTVNELRLAFQTQRYFEQLARGGSRYTEYMRNFYGVVSPDARLQRPEYLGGHREPISISQVLNQSQSQTDFLGDVGAMSVTSGVQDDFEKSFTEFGYVIGLVCVRYDHLVGTQGIERFWTRRDLFDTYSPTFAHIGEQPKFTYELYANGFMDSDQVFGYQEAWSDYRYKPSRVSGEMRPGISNSLASWHLGDYYTQAPTLSDAWIREDKTNVDRVLAVTSATSNQVLCDIFVKNTCTRVMPMFSVPGLIDHF